MQKVYDDELRPVHPMLAALRSGDPERIAEYSDLIVPNIDQKLLKLTASIQPPAPLKNETTLFEENPQAQRLYNLLVGMDCEVEQIAPLVKRVLETHPDLTTPKMIELALKWYESQETPHPQAKAKSIHRKEWHTLDSEDLRFIFSQTNPKDMYKDLKQKSMILNMEDWLDKSG